MPEFPTSTVLVGRHTVTIERLEPLRWRVSVDGDRVASFCSESRAKAAGRLEARRRDYGLRRPTPRGQGGLPG